jgi:hypothetical protein
MSFFEHAERPHQTGDANTLHAVEKIAAGFNQRLAVAITKATGSMPCAYVFAFIAFLGFPALSAWLGPFVALYVLWLSSEFIQLVMLPILSVGQQVLGRHQEIMAEEQFKTTENSYHDIEQIIQHLDAQDEKILEILQKIEAKP